MIGRRGGNDERYAGDGAASLPHQPVDQLRPCPVFRQPYPAQPPARAAGALPDRLRDRRGRERGGYGMFLRELGYGGGSVPSSRFLRLPQTVAAASRDPCWEVFGFALGSRSGSAILHVSEFSQMSSFPAGGRYGFAQLVEPAGGIGGTVAVRTLADCFDAGLVPKNGRILLKMDAGLRPRGVPRFAVRTSPRLPACNRKCR